MKTISYLDKPADRYNFITSCVSPMTDGSGLCFIYPCQPSKREGTTWQGNLSFPRKRESRSCDVGSCCEVTHPRPWIPAYAGMTVGCCWTPAFAGVMIEGSAGLRLATEGRRWNDSVIITLHEGALVKAIRHSVLRWTPGVGVQALVASVSRRGGAGWLRAR